MSSESLLALVEGAVLSPGQASHVARILDDYLADLERGAPAHPEQLLQQHPDVADVLRVYLNKLDLLHHAAVNLRDSLPTGEPIGADRAALGQLGDFLIRREIGRGGMGIVYEAEQISLGRRVALKVLPFAAALDAKQLQRFKNEAQAAAQLHHPHMVPVYAVGCERGVHYYAMQFIEGNSLAHVIADFRLQIADLQTNDPAATGPHLTGAQAAIENQKSKIVPCPRFQRNVRFAIAPSSVPWHGLASRRPKLWIMPTRWAWSTAMSSRPTCCSMPVPRCGSPISG
jgi:hypothetical protein